MANETMQHLCDGCGATVDPEHVRQRIARLEMATRFRPLHIQTLLLRATPEEQLEDFFYWPESTCVRSEENERFCDAVMGAAGVELANAPRSARLVALQRAGLFLAYVHECTGERQSREKSQDLLRRRILYSYRPKNVLPVDAVARGAIEEIAPSLAPIRIHSDAALRMPPEPGATWEDFQERLRADLNKWRD